MASRHRRTHDIYGHTMTFHAKNEPIIMNTLNTTNNKKLRLNFKFIELNAKWRFNIETDILKLEKFNSETQLYETKFNFT